MGQKVNPHGLRVGIIKDWDSRWFADKSTFGDTLVEDYNIRKFIKKNLYAAGVPKIEIERTANKVRININCAKPGQVIGRGGEAIEKLRADVEKMIGKPVNLNIFEVKSPDLNAQLVAEKIAADLENRVSFRRAMKSAIGRAMKLGAKGIKIKASGRLGGATTAPLRLPPPTAESASRYGSTRARYSRESFPRPRRSPTEDPAVPETETTDLAAETVTSAEEIPSPSTTEKTEKEVISNVTSKESKVS